MTALQGLFQRNIQNPTVPLTSQNLLDFLNGFDPALSATGIAVTPESSLTMSAVWRAWSVTSGVASAMPLHTYQADTKNRVPAPLLRQPHPDMTRLELWRLTYVHRLGWGNAFVQKVRNRAGEVKELWPITPGRCRAGRVKSTDANPAGKLFEVTDDWGVQRTLTTRDIMHIPSMGYDGVTGLSPIRAAMGAIALGLAAEKSGASFFGRGAQLSGVLQTEQRLEQAQADALQARWQAKMAGTDNAHKIGVLDSGAKFQPVTMPLKDAQFLETRQFQVPEIARFYGVPLFLMFETAKSTSWGTGLEQQALGWIVFDLSPTWLAPTEQRIEKELLPEDVDARYNVNGLLRGDSAARGSFYQIMRQVGAYSANDIRDREDLPPVDGGETYLVPLNMADLKDAGKTPPAPGAPPVPDDEEDEDDDASE